MKTAMCDLLGIEYPIMQGAMANISHASLVAAVSEAGGLGILAASLHDEDFVRGEIRKIKEKTKKPFGVNINMMSLHKEKIAQLVIDEGVSVVTTGAGNPAPFIPMWVEAGIKVIPVIPNVKVAKKMESLGATAVVAEGMESGGHIGSLTTMALVPQVVDAIDIPVIAAGGIADGKGFVAALALGAIGVQVGTMFLVADECQIHDAYKEKVVMASDTDTVVTGGGTGHVVRTLKNDFTTEFLRLEAIGESTLEDRKSLGAGSLLRAVNGDTANGGMMAGQISGMVQKRATVAEIIAEFMASADLVYNKFKN